MSGPTTAMAGVPVPALQLVNMSTGEHLQLRDPASLTAAEAYHLHTNLDAFIQELFWWRRRCAELIEQDLTAEGASERLVDGILYRFAGDESWVVDVDKLESALADLVVEGKLDQADRGRALKVETVTTKKADNRVLNQLCEKRGMAVAAAIGQCRRRVAGAPKLSIQRVGAPS